MKIQFLGGVQTVTGSKTLVTGKQRSVLVDCGLFQGLKELRLLNRSPFPFEPRKLGGVLLTHAHLDHSGALPLMVRQGFSGKIYCSTATRDLAELLLKDSAKIQEEDADYANRKGYSRHHPAEPIYNTEDVERTLERFETRKTEQWHDLNGEFKFRLMPSGHILGSTFVELEVSGQTIVFSGDLGRSQPLLYDPPVQINHADYLVLESTYGDRNHPAAHHGQSIETRLANIIQKTVDRGGQVIIASFAVGRAQDLIYLLSKIKSQGKLPNIPVYLDTPMGDRATQIFLKNDSWHRLTRTEVDRFEEVAQVLKTQKDSIQVMREGCPAVIIAGSGMLAGGRVLHHLEARLSDAKNTILLVGFQAAGTRGRLLKDGADELKMHGKYVPVRAEIESLDDLSAHADQHETIQWLRGFSKPPKRTWINHGEPQASHALALKITDTLGWRCDTPLPLQEYEVSPH